jgi:hypothetical protein
MIRVEARPSAWVHGVVEAYDSRENLWDAVLDATGDRVRVHRLSLCFDSEHVSLFVSRLHAAHTMRTSAAKWTRFHTFRECMPMDDVGSPSAETIRRCTDAAIATALLAKAFSPSSSVVTSLTKVSQLL